MKRDKRFIEGIELALGHRKFRFTTYYPSLSGSRIANATRVWQAVEDAIITGWDKAADFILATAITEPSKAELSYAYKLQWRNKTDAGTFADVGSTGDITYSAVTDLVDGNAVLTGESGCTGTGTWQNGLENEEDNLLPDSGTFILLEDHWSELHWALDCSNALDNKEYEFRLLTTGDVEIGLCLATLTIATGVLPPTTQYLAGNDCPPFPYPMDLQSDKLPCPPPYD